jgi:hypothetical protein
MEQIIEAEGIEKAVISSWTGWDGDNTYLTFSGVVFQPEVLDYLVGQGLDLGVEIFVSINLENSTVDITGYSEDEESTVWERKLQLKASLVEVEEYTVSQRYSL